MVANTILIPCNLVISSNLAHFYVRINLTKKYSPVRFCRIYYLMGKYSYLYQRKLYQSYIMFLWTSNVYKLCTGY